MIILGAGLAGTLAGALNQDAEIFEFGDNDTTHQAVLRFRSPDIGEAVGIPFKKVTVYKNVWEHGHQPLSNKHIIDYSKKVSSIVSCRSITDLDTVERWVAPADFHQQLKAQCEGRIQYNIKMDKEFVASCQLTLQPIISTIPLHILCDLLEMPIVSKFSDSQEIYVTRLLFPRCDVYMTNYYPGEHFYCYRASITGDNLIMESMDKIYQHAIDQVLASFGLSNLHYDTLVSNHRQERGKIRSIDESVRRRTVLTLTLEHGIFSLGRFATWRNILLDDVYKDIHVIKRLANKDQYEIHRSLK